MRILKYIAGILILFYLMPTVFADITIQLPEQEVYNIGDTIDASISVKENNDQSGFFKLEFRCEEDTLQYYVAPLTVEKDVRIGITTPDIIVPEGLRGACNLRAYFQESDGSTIAAALSDEFRVSKLLVVEAGNTMQAKPGERLILVATVKTESNSPIEGTASIQFEEYEAAVNVSAGKLRHTIPLRSTLPSGTYSISLEAHDAYDNEGYKTIQLEIVPVPTNIETTLQKKSVVPYGTLAATVTLLDHTGNLMNEVLQVAVIDEAENQIQKKEVTSGTQVEFEVNNELEPGNYFVTSTFQELQGRTAFTIEELKKLSMRQHEGIVTIENTGNVKYNDEVTIVARNNEKNFIINKNINLDPGETATIDLSKEVPEGNYDVVLPQEHLDENESNVAENIVIPDNRNLAKRGFGSIAFLTGAVVDGASFLISKPLFAAAFIVLVVGGIFAFYTKPLIRSFKRKKDDEETDNLFKDFDYEK